MEIHARCSHHRFVNLHPPSELLALIANEHEPASVPKSLRRDPQRPHSHAGNTCEFEHSSYAECRWRGSWVGEPAAVRAQN